jgi:hypothetical protein
MYTSASLMILNDGDSNFGGFHCNCERLIYHNYDVKTPIDELNATHYGAVDIFNDLGSGVSYGSVSISTADNGKNVIVPLNAAALHSINTSVGSEWAVGGT